MNDTPEQYIKWLKFEMEDYERDEREMNLGPYSRLMLKTFRIALNHAENELTQSKDA